MEHHTNKTSSLPANLRPFHRPALTTQPTTTLPIDRSSHSQWKSRKQPHGRDSSLRARLKALVANVSPDPTSRHTPQAPFHHCVESRAHMKRMKDSDDYITARGANPRTGLISPSVGTRTPCTPDSPGEALKRYSVKQNSPTPAQKERPALGRANEGRKISSASARHRNGRETALQQDHMLGAFPRTQLSDPVKQCQPEAAPSPELRDDQFVVNMPSAREPQPFSYPGYTAEQIDALEHYRRKARRVSSDGYDRRLFHRQSSCKAYADCTCEDQHSTDNTTPLHTRQFIPYNNDDYYQDRTYEDVEPPIIMIRKRANAKPTRITHHNADEAIRVPDNDHKSKKSLMPPSMPKTSPTRDHQYNPSSSEGSLPKHSATLGVNREILQNLKSSTDLAPRSIMPVANVRTGSLAGDQYDPDDKNNVALPSRQPPESSSTTSLISRLPKVRLVKPEHAAIPKSSRKISDRLCSFGCPRDGNGGECAERRRRHASDATVVRQSSVLFHDQKSDISSAKYCNMDIAEMFLESATSTLRYLGSLQVPRIDTLELLKDPEVSTREKAEALKTVLSLAGHALAVCTLLAMLWHLGAAVMHLLEVVFWPLAVPLRLMRWIAGAG